MLGDPRFIADGSGQTSLSVPGYRLLSGSPLLGAGVVMADDGGRDIFGSPTSVELLQTLVRIRGRVLLLLRCR